MLGAGGLATATSFARLGLLLQKNSFNDATLNFTKFNLLGWVILLSQVIISKDQIQSDEHQSS